MRTHPTCPEEVSAQILVALAVLAAFVEKFVEYLPVRTLHQECLIDAASAHAVVGKVPVSAVRPGLPELGSAPQVGTSLVGEGWRR